MKNIIIVFFSALSILSCKENQSNAAVAVNDSNYTDTLVAKKLPDYPYEIRYKDWEIGNPENIKTVLDFYRAWDDKDPARVSALFSDTLRLRIPNERTEITLPKERINEALSKNRSMYDSTSNTILSAVSLHDKERGEDWVMITTYNKWKEKNGKRDSLLYQDNWKLKEGKLFELMSYSKLPTRQFLNKIDPKK